MANEDELSALDGQDIPLTSTTLISCRYDKSSQTLDLTFTSGRTYTLNDVPPDQFLGLVHANSPGQYFNANLKGKYL